jgi:hypothetical protein
MVEKNSHSHIISSIRKFAGLPERVRTTQSAYFDMMAWSLEKADVCDAIAKWIDEGKEVEEIVTKYASGHTGEPAYVMRPLLCGQVFYVKVSLPQDANGVETLLIVSAHPDRR